MKKFLLTLAIALGLTQITQAQSSCDSTMSYTVGSQYQLEIAFGIGGNNLSTWSAPLYVVTYGDGNMLAEDSCFANVCTHMIYNYNMSTGMPYDTITTCISYTVTDSLGYVDTTSCCFNQVWDGQAWMLMSMPVGINEITNKLINNKMYDLYGREMLKPKGIYIQNRKVKYVR